jgi:hypothetical protein
MSIWATNQPAALSPFRFDTAPSGEADVNPDQIAVLDNQGQASEAFGFKDFLDVINPLQHIPIISTIYRAVTGDEIGPAPRAIGGALYGGPVGILAALGNNIVEAETGSDIGETAIAMFSGARDQGDPGVKTHPAELGTPQLAAAPVIPVAEAPVAALSDRPMIPAAPLTPVPTEAPSLPALQKKPAAPAPGSLMAKLAATPPRKSGGFIPSDAAARAGLFGNGPQPVPLPPASLQSQESRLSSPAASLQSAPGNALDQLIARSQAAHAQRSASATAPSLQVPADNSNVHEWMLKALGKYETMPKG